MPVRKKPIGEELASFCRFWDKADHEGKIKIAQAYKTSYDVCKHWRSDSSVDYPLPERKRAEEPSMRVTVDELLEMRPAVNLDFVTFDLETSNLQADFSILLSAVIKPFGCPPIVFRADSYKAWTTDRANDREIVEAVANELRKHAIVISHYGINFDVPYLRAKMVKHGLEPLPQMFGIDSWVIARKNFQVSSRRLKNLANYFDIGEKEPVEGGLWMAAAYNGNKEAMDKIVSHNIVDCEVLEKLAAITFPYLRSIPRL